MPAGDWSGQSSMYMTAACDGARSHGTDGRVLIAGGGGDGDGGGGGGGSLSLSVHVYVCCLPGDRKGANGCAGVAGKSHVCVAAHVLLRPAAPVIVRVIVEVAWREDEGDSQRKRGTAGSAGYRRGRGPSQATKPRGTTLASNTSGTGRPAPRPSTATTSLSMWSHVKAAFSAHVRTAQL